jgi:hypothetical protein
MTLRQLGTQCKTNRIFLTDGLYSCALPWFAFENSEIYSLWFCNPSSLCAPPMLNVDPVHHWFLPCFHAKYLQTPPLFILWRSHCSFVTPTCSMNLFHLILSCSPALPGFGWHCYVLLIHATAHFYLYLICEPSNHLCPQFRGLRMLCACPSTCFGSSEALGPWAPISSGASDRVQYSSRIMYHRKKMSRFKGSFLVLSFDNMACWIVHVQLHIICRN